MPKQVCRVDEERVRSYSEHYFLGNDWPVRLGVTLIKQDRFCQYFFVFYLISLTWLLSQIVTILPFYGLAP